MTFPRSKLAIYLMLLGVLLLCTIQPSFEGFDSVTDDSVTYDDSETTTPPPPPPPPPPLPDSSDDDLYILKSQIVPPVCPACPTACPKSKSSDEECPACPPCARCPTPAYNCKLVPDYESTAPVPIPILNDFSTF